MERTRKKGEIKARTRQPGELREMKYFETAMLHLTVEKKKVRTKTRLEYINPSQASRFRVEEKEEKGGNGSAVLK